MLALHADAEPWKCGCSRHALWPAQPTGSSIPAAGYEVHLNCHAVQHSPATERETRHILSGRSMQPAPMVYQPQTKTSPPIPDTYRHKKKYGGKQEPTRSMLCMSLQQQPHKPHKIPHPCNHDPHTNPTTFLGQTTLPLQPKDMHVMSIASPRQHTALYMHLHMLQVGATTPSLSNGHHIRSKNAVNKACCQHCINSARSANECSAI